MTARNNLTSSDILAFPLISFGVLSLHFGVLFISARHGARRRRELRIAAGFAKWSGAWTVAGGA